MVVVVGGVAVCRRRQWAGPGGVGQWCGVPTFPHPTLPSLPSLPACLTLVGERWRRMGQKEQAGRQAGGQ